MIVVAAIVCGAFLGAMTARKTARAQGSTWRSTRPATESRSVSGAFRVLARSVSAMFLRFFDHLSGGVPVSREYLTFLEALKAGLVTYDVEGFYYLARAAMVKDERHIDRFDRAFARPSRGSEAITLDRGARGAGPAAEWLRSWPKST
jgi:hypothetical protein